MSDTAEIPVAPELENGVAGRDRPGAKRQLVLETLSALLGVFLITVAYTAVRPLVVGTGIVPVIILYELALYVVLVALVATIIRVSGRSLSEALGFRWRPAGRQVLTGFAIFALTITFIIVPLLLGADRAEVLSFKPRSPWVLIYYAIHGFIFVGFGEELVWRGYFLGRFRDITGSGAWAVVISSLLFGLWHFPNGQNIAQVFVTAGLGAVYALARLRLRDCSTLATGLAHGLHDTAILLLSYLLP